MCSAASTPMSSSIKMDKDEYGQGVDITTYRGIIGSLLYLRASRLDILFIVGVCGRFQKEANFSCNFNNGSETSCPDNSCAQLLWIPQQLRDFGITAEESQIFCENTSEIARTYNPVLHSRTKNIDIRHHFIREYVQ
ncbi:uncharacterized protein LOC124930251 [Impatiens glandulifera]|uniref:uncharacterized protein LOC124930251 n=1 Tax=Impatiens glandulifera TaxID=253017 RepID=UPI001FB087E3|nr:uncharacterized protein LOC124930251 [Impatiens glandulifera]